jgi:hypothetical protein
MCCNRPASAGDAFRCIVQIAQRCRWLGCMVCRTCGCNLNDTIGSVLWVEKKFSVRPIQHTLFQDGTNIWLAVVSLSAIILAIWPANRVVWEGSAACKPARPVDNHRPSRKGISHAEAREVVLSVRGQRRRQGSFDAVQRAKVPAAPNYSPTGKRLFLASSRFEAPASHVRAVPSTCRTISTAAGPDSICGEWAGE